MAPLTIGPPASSKEDFMFSVICYLVLMEGNGGLISKHPDYVFDKMRMIQQPADICYSMLDRPNQEVVLKWCETWHYQIPESVFEYERQRLQPE